jgi:putative transposase
MRKNAETFLTLKIKQFCQFKKCKQGMHKSRYNTGNASRFVGSLTYITELKDKKVIEINERNTTKRHNMPVWKRGMICDCGNSTDRDRNSAVNSVVRSLAQNALWTSYRKFADNLLKTELSVDGHSQEARSKRPVSSLMTRV